MNKKIFLVLAFFLAFAFLNLVSAQTSPSPYGIPTATVYGSENSEDMLIWVTNYDPKILRSDLLEENDVPIIARIQGMQINPFISIPRITSVNVRPATLSKDVAIGGSGYLRPSGTINTNDLGWIVVNIRRIPTEDKMPDSIDLNLTATIKYDFEDQLGFGRKDFSLGLVNENKWREDEWRYEFWDNSGFLRLLDISADGQRATIGVYDSSKREINKFTLASGQKSEPALVNVHGKRGYVLVTMNNIETPSSAARVKVNFGGKDYESLLKVNSPLFSGSDWKVTNLNPFAGGGGSITIRNSKGNQQVLAVNTRSITLENGEMRTVGDQVNGAYIAWITESTVYFINTTNPAVALSEIRNSIKSVGVEGTFKKTTSLYKLVNIPINFKISAPKYSSVLDNPDAKIYFDSVLTKYQEIIEGADVSVNKTDLNEAQYKESWIKSALWRSYDFAKTYDQAKASEYLRKLIETYPNDASLSKWQNELKAAIEFNYEQAHAFLDNKGMTVSVLLEEIENPDSTSEANLILNGVQGPYSQGSIIDSEWYLSRIDTTTITLTRNGVTSSQVVAVGNEFILNQTTKTKLKVVSTKVDKQASVSISPYSREGMTTSNFSIHVAIEKRGIQLSTSQMQDQIKQTDEQIKQLEKFTTDMSGVITGMRNTCFATYAVLIAKKLFTDWSGIESSSRNIAMRGLEGNAGWIQICQDEIAKQKEVGGTPGKGLFYSSVQDCLSNHVKDINEQTASIKTNLESVQKVMKDTTIFKKDGVIDWTKLQSQCGFSNEGNENIKNYIGNQQTLDEKFEGAKLTQTEIEKLCLYNQLDGNYKKGSIGVYAEAHEKLGAFSSSYEKDNKIIGGLDASLKIINIADAGKKYSELDILGKADREALLNTAYQNEQYLGSKIDKQVTAIKIFDDKNLALIPEVSASPVSVEKKDGKWYYPNAADEKTRKEVVSVQKCIKKDEQVQLRAYKSGTNKGKPAMVPFDKGWVEVTQYDSNGNVKRMQLHITSPLADGTCPDFPYDVGADYKAFPSAYQPVITSAAACVNNAIIALKNKQTTFSCGGKSAPVGAEYAPRAEQNYCEDFFSRGDCNILYQVCDPVICPASRCDFGGRFPVSNVIQSGVIGSMLLCAPNFPTPAIAVCLPGVRAGLMGYTSMLKGYKQCMQTQIDKGETVGICDRIRSLYWCDLLWKTALSMYDAFGGVYGIITGTFDKAKGGGELLSVPSGLQEADKSFKYFTSVYAEDTFVKFNALNSEQIGGYVCQRAIYGTVPGGLDIFSDISSAEVPPQFFGHVEESPYSTVNQPVSHYKVYFHIYAGEKKGIYYKVYLSNPISSPFTTTPLANYNIDSGYVDKGGYIDKSPDFLAASGYRQLCIDIDGVPYCGFGWTSSEMAIQELTDLYASKLASSNIQSEDECMFSSPALVPSPLGQGIEGTNLLVRRGINRICSSGDPNAGSGTRVWDPVGWCDKTKGVKCWLDTSSVSGAITDVKIEQDTLQNAIANISAVLKEGYKTRADIRDKLDNQAYKKYRAKDYLGSIYVCEQILKEASPIETDLLDEAKFIIGLNNEQMLNSKAIEIQKQTIAAAGTSAECQGAAWETIITKNLKEKKFSLYDATSLIEAIISYESNGDTKAISDCGAVGLMQLMPGIARDYGLKTFENANFVSCMSNNQVKPDVAAYVSRIRATTKDSTVDERFDAEKNIRAGIKFFEALYAQYNDADKAIGAYLGTGTDVYGSTPSTYLIAVRNKYNKCAQNKISLAISSTDSRITSITNKNLPATNTICEIAKMYFENKIEVSREGDTTLTCSRFVSEVLYNAGVFQLPTVGACDLTSDLKNSLGTVGKQIILSEATCGDILIINSAQSTGSGLHAAIFKNQTGNLVNAYSEPGASEPVIIKSYNPSQIDSIYRITGHMLSP